MLNCDNSLGPPPSCEEVNLLDDTLSSCLDEVDKAKCSIMSFLAQFIDENSTSRKSKNKINTKKKVVSNKKRKRNEYIKLQDLYRRIGKQHTTK